MNKTGKTEEKKYRNDDFRHKCQRKNNNEIIKQQIGEIKVGEIENIDQKRSVISKEDVGRCVE